MITLRSLLAFVVCLHCTSAELSFSKDGNDFSIYYNGVLLFEQTEGEPLLQIGYGNTTFTEQQGNFHVTDELLESHPVDILEIWEYNDVMFEGFFVSSEDMSIRLTFNLDVAVTPLNTEVLLLKISPSYNITMVHNRIKLQVKSSAAERFYGGGEQYTYFNMKGHHFPIWTSEQGVGRDGGIIANITDIAGAGGTYYTTYYPAATYVSSQRYIMAMSNHKYMVLNFTRDDYVDIDVHSLNVRATIYWAETMVDLLKLRSYSVPFLPDWITTGAILGLQSGTDEILKYYEMAKEAGVNTSALWIQDWSGTTETLLGHRVYWNWKWNQTYYPNLDTVIQDLADEGVKMTLYINPHLIEGSELFLEAQSGGHLMTNSEGETFLQDFGGFMAGTVDLISQESLEWYRDQIIHNMIELGATGWMADFGEYTRLDMVSKVSEYTPEEIHNILPLAWAQCNMEAATAPDITDPIIYWMRSGTNGSPQYQTLAWAGDQNVDFSIADGVASTIVAALSLGMSGMTVTHFDIGGYTTQSPVLRRSKELFLRSAEYAVFTPVMRTHEGNKPAQNHQFYSDADTLKQFARLTQIHSLLSEYTQSLNSDSISGLPMQRPMFLHYESDINTWDLQYQYMYGRDLIVAPVIHRGQETVNLYIPEGGGEEWQHMWDKHDPVVAIGPANLTVSTPMGYPAVYFRMDSPYAQLFIRIRDMYGM